MVPSAGQGTLTSALGSVHGSKATLAVGALLGWAWAGISGWWSIDTALRDVRGSTRWPSPYCAAPRPTQRDVRQCRMFTARAVTSHHRHQPRE